MPTIQELTDENITLKAQVSDLQTELARHKDVTIAVEGILHQVDVHGATPEDLKDAIVVFKAKRAVANTKPPVEEPEIIE